MKDLIRLGDTQCVYWRHRMQLVDPLLRLSIDVRVRTFPQRSTILQSLSGFGINTDGNVAAVTATR